MAHMLDATADRDVVHAGCDQSRGEVDRLLRRSALPVDGRRRSLDRQAGLEPGVAADVVRLLPVLLDAAGDDVLDLGRIDAGPCQHLHEDRSEQLVRVDVPVVPLLGMAAAHRCPYRLDDHDLTSVQCPFPSW